MNEHALNEHGLEEEEEEEEEEGKPLLQDCDTERVQVAQPAL